MSLKLEDRRFVENYLLSVWRLWSVKSYNIEVVYFSYNTFVFYVSLCLICYVKHIIQLVNGILTFYKKLIRKLKRNMIKCWNTLLWYRNINILVIFFKYPSRWKAHSCSKKFIHALVSYNNMQVFHRYALNI